MTLPYRSQCTCDCHMSGMRHIGPCCQRDTIPSEATRLESAYRRGLNAHIFDLPESDNPYLEGTSEHRRWHEGFNR